MYPVYCITTTGITNYITQPISLENNDCECYLLHWEPCLKMCNAFAYFNRFIFLNVYILIMGFFFCFVPTTCITTFLYFVSWFFCFMNGCLWWITFIKIWWHLLSHNRISIVDILIDTNTNSWPKNTPQLLWVCGKCYSTVISEKMSRIRTKRQI